MKRTLQLSLCILSAVAWPGITVAAEPAFVYHYKTKQVLQEYPNQLAIQRPGGGGSGLAAGLMERGLSAGTAENLVLDWWKVQVDLPIARGIGATSDLMRDAVSSATLDANNAFVSPVFVGRDGHSVMVTPTIIVRFESHVSDTEARDIISGASSASNITRDWGGMKGAYQVRVTSRNGYDVLDMANALATDPAVRLAEPDMLFTGSSAFTPNDPGFPVSWGLHNTGQTGGVADMDLDMPEAWDITTGDPAIKVLVLDNGVQHDHPDINQLPGADFTGEVTAHPGGPVNTCDNHGTPVAGCVTGIINNGIGTTGAAPGCKVLSARPFVSVIGTPCTGSWSTIGSWTVDALEWGRQQGARISNNSNSYGFYSAIIEEKYQQTRDAGMVHFGSAGNQKSTSIAYPAELPTIIAISAIDHAGKRSSFSNHGPDSQLTAPGSNIYLCDRTGPDGYSDSDYYFSNGTSYASPLAAGVAALMLSVNPGLTPGQIEAILVSTAQDLGDAGFDWEYGWGLIKAARALESSQGASAGNWALYE